MPFAPVSESDTTSSAMAIPAPKPSAAPMLKIMTPIMRQAVVTRTVEVRGTSTTSVATTTLRLTSSLPSSIAVGCSLGL